MIEMCCPDLEKLLAKPGRAAGLGLTVMINRRGSSFLIEYRKDWQIPSAEAGMQVRFCPYCGRKLDDLLSKT